MSHIAQPPDAAEYYAGLRRSVFEGPDQTSKNFRLMGVPKVRFILQKQFDFGAPFIAYDFLVDLSQAFGRHFKLMDFANGCVAVEVALLRGHDYLGRDFRYLMLTNDTYHAIFRNYSVSDIYIRGFPHARGQIPNVDCPRFRVNSDGRPEVPFRKEPKE
jgi:hypothetical protein